MRRRRSPRRPAMRARKAARDSRRRETDSAATSAIHVECASASSALISSPVSPSHRPIANSRSADALDGHEAVGFGDDLGAPTCPDEIARVDRVEGGCRPGVRRRRRSARSPSGDSGTSRCPMKRRVSAPTTLPWRTRYTVVADRSRCGISGAASDEVAVGAGRAEDEPRQFGQLHAGAQGVAGQAAEPPRRERPAPRPRRPARPPPSPRP